jgi:arylsulfatase A-like enzyme
VLESLVRDRSTYYGYPYSGIRTGRWLYVEYETGDRELYDLTNDPDQLESLATDPAYATTVAYLARKLDGLADCAGPACRKSVGPVPAPATKKGSE